MIGSPFVKQSSEGFEVLTQTQRRCVPLHRLVTQVQQTFSQLRGILCVATTTELSGKLSFSSKIILKKKNIYAMEKF